MNADQRGKIRDAQLVSFPEWKDVLAAASMAAGLKAVYRQEIFAFLHHCKIHHAGASIMLVKEYLAVAETQGRTRAREALRWWFRAAQRGGRPSGQSKLSVEVEEQRASEGRAADSRRSTVTSDPCGRWAVLTSTRAG